MAEAIVSSTVSKVVDLLFGKVIKEISYIRSCTENVEKFKAEVEMLKVLRGKVQQQIEIANSKGDNLITGVEEWVKKADTKISKAEEFLNEEANAKKTCFKIGLCGNWHTLYHYGKTATKIIGGYFEYYSAANLKRRHLVIQTDYAESSFLKWNKQLIEACHTTDLDSIQNLNNILSQLYHEGFNELEHINLYKCRYVSCLIDTANWDQLHTFNLPKHIVEGKIKEMFLGKLKHLRLVHLQNLVVLWKCPDQYISLSNLVTLNIFYCHKLVKVFPVSVAKGLVSLQNLYIGYCDSLEEVIWDGDEETSKSETEHSEYIVFRSLVKIYLYELERLERFYSGHSTIKYPSLVDADIEYCPRMKMWGPGIHETPKLKIVTNVQLDGPDATINDAVNKLLETEQFRWELRFAKRAIRQHIKKKRSQMKK